MYEFFLRCVNNSEDIKTTRIDFTMFKEYPRFFSS